MDINWLKEVARNSLSVRFRNLESKRINVCVGGNKLEKKVARNSLSVYFGNLENQRIVCVHWNKLVNLGARNLLSEFNGRKINHNFCLLHILYLRCVTYKENNEIGFLFCISTDSMPKARRYQPRRGLQFSQQRRQNWNVRTKLILISKKAKSELNWLLEKRSKYFE